MLDAGRTGSVTIGADGSRCGQPLTLLVESSVPPPRMIVFGAIDFASALVRAGKFLGYHVTLCDARPVFATKARFPEADELVVDWPHRYLAATEVDARTVLCVLTHDAKFDVPLLELGLRLPVAYVGAMACAALIWSATTGCAKSASRSWNWPGCTRRSASISAPEPPRRPRCRSPPKSSPTGAAAAEYRSRGRTHRSITKATGRRRQ